MKRKKRLIILSVLVIIVVFVFGGLCIRNARLSRATHYGDTFQVDGKVYADVNYTEIYPYNVTSKVIFKTTDGAWSFYEIEEYPNHEYVHAQCLWEGRLLKQVE